MAGADSMPHKTSYRERSQSFKGARLVARVSQSLRNLACLSKALMTRRLPNFKVIREFLHRILRLRVFMRSWNKTSSRYIESVPWCSSYTLCCSCVFAEAIKNMNLFALPPMANSFLRNYSLHTGTKVYRMKESLEFLELRIEPDYFLWIWEK